LPVDATAVAKITGKYLAAIHALTDLAKEDLTTLLTKITQHADEHQERTARRLRAN
jgi:hypothetical protein